MTIASKSDVVASWNIVTHVIDNGDIGVGGSAVSEAEPVVIIRITN